MFNYGKISFECLRELSHILTGYSNVMKEYGVDQYKVVGTTALREAQNKGIHSRSAFDSKRYDC